MISALRGRLIPAVPVIFGADGVLDVEANARYAAWMANQDIGGVAIWAHTGRGLHLTADQRSAVLEAWVAAARVPVVCGAGVPHATTIPTDPGARTRVVVNAVAAMAREAKAGGAQLVMVHPPTPLRALPNAEERVLDVYRAVSEVGLPVLAFYLYERAGGIPFQPAVVERLLAMDAVIGIKVATLDSVMTFQDLVSVVRGVPSALLVTGEDRFLGYSIMQGADAALVGIGAACTDVTAALMAAWFGGEYEAFHRLSRAVDGFSRATFSHPMEGYVQRMVWALEEEGVITPGCDPFAPRLPSSDRETVVAAVRKLRAS